MVLKCNVNLRKLLTAHKRRDQLINGKETETEYLQVRWHVSVARWRVAASPTTQNWSPLVQWIVQFDCGALRMVFQWPSFQRASTSSRSLSATTSERSLRLAIEAHLANSSCFKSSDRKRKVGLGVRQPPRQ